MNEDFLRACVKSSPSVSIPLCTRGLDYRACFYHSATPDADQLLTDLNTSRQAMLGIFAPSSTSTAVQEKLLITESYLTQLWTLFTSLNAQGPVELDRPLRFDWASYIYTSKKEMAASSSGLVFELIMVLHLKACLHHAIAKSIIDANFNDVAESAKHLAVAASVMKFLEVNVLPRWPSEGAIRPCEAKPEYCSLYYNFYLASAQQMFAFKAIQSNSALAPKLCLCVSELFTNCLSCVPPQGLEILFGHVGIMRCFFQALAFKLRAEQLHSKCETGQALGYCNLAKNLLQEQSKYDPLKIGIPKLSSLTPPLTGGIMDLKRQIDVTFTASNNDNRLIYFLPVPSTISEFSEPFQGLLAVKLTAYEAPILTRPVIFEYDTSRRPSVLGKIVASISAIFRSDGTDTSATGNCLADEKKTGSMDSVVSMQNSTPTQVLSFLPPPPVMASQLSATGTSAPPLPGNLVRSDSDLARELDRQLNS